MNTPEFNIDKFLSKRGQPNVEKLFNTLKLSKLDKKRMEARFYEIAKMVYEDPQGLSDDTVLKMKLWETNPEIFSAQNEHEQKIIEQYLDFVECCPDWDKVWRVLSAHYKPSNS